MELQKAVPLFAGRHHGILYRSPRPAYISGHTFLHYRSDNIYRNTGAVLRFGYKHGKICKHSLPYNAYERHNNDLHGNKRTLSL